MSEQQEHERREMGRLDRFIAQLMAQEGGAATAAWAQESEEQRACIPHLRSAVAALEQAGPQFRETVDWFKDKLRCMVLLYGDPEAPEPRGILNMNGSATVFVPRDKAGPGCEPGPQGTEEV